MKNNPYLGPRPYERGDRRNFFGRDRDARDLVALILAEREVLFYAQSGAGKTSLLNAQVIPTLEEEGFRVLPVMRVGSSLPPGISDQAVSNIFVLSALMGLAGTNIPVEALPKHTLLSFLREFCKPPDGAKRRPPLLILDQFEELFTTHQDRWKDAEGFFHQVREALEAEPSLGIVLAMREDHVAELDPYIRFLSYRLLGRYRMERLRYEEALEAVARPALNAGCPFGPGVAERLVENLCQIKVPGAEEAGHEAIVSGRYVEAVQLQVVCQQLWEDLPDAAGGDRVIQWEEVERYGNVDRALTNFYESVLAQTVRETKVKERDLRRWFSTKLITPMQTRGLVLKEEKSTAGLPSEAVAVLDKQLLIRADMRAGAWWYELVHDRLVDPILESNRKWEAARQTPLRTTAKQWQETKSEGLLYRDKVLKEAAAWAKANADEAEPYEQEFLTASLQAEQIRMKRRRLFAAGAIAAVAILVVMAALTVFAVKGQNDARAAEATAESSRQEAVAARAKAEVAERQARARLLATQGQNVFDDTPLLGLRLMLEAWYVAPQEEHPAIEQSIQTLMRYGRLQRLGNDVEGMHTSVHTPYLLFDRAGAPGEIRYTATGALVTTLSGPVQDWGVKFAPPGDYVWISYDGRPSELRQTSTGQRVFVSDKGGTPTFCSDGRYFFITYENKSSEIRRTETGEVIRALGAGEFDVNAGSGAIFSPACTQFVACQGKEVCKLYEMANKGFEIAAKEFMFSPKGTYVVINKEPSPNEIRRTDTYQIVGAVGDFRSVIFSPDETYWIVKAKSGTSEVRWANGRAAMQLPDNLANIWVSPGGTYFIADFPNGTRNLYRIDTQAWVALRGGGSWPEFSPDGRYFFLDYRDSQNRVDHIELHHAHTNQIFTFDNAYNLNTATFSPDQAYFILMFQGPSPAELRWAENGELVTLFDRPLHDGDFSVDSTYFVARFRDGTHELWNFRTALRLTKLGLSLGSGAIGGEDEGYHFDMDSKRLIVWYTNGQVYLLDINWLEMMTTAASSDDLLRVACWPFKSTNFFDEAALKSYLENTPPQACRP